MATETKTLDVCGDILEIRWDGNVWVSPSNGQQHAHAKDAMRYELEKYFSECGDDPADNAKEIEGYLSDVTDA